MKMFQLSPGSDDKPDASAVDKKPAKLGKNSKMRIAKPRRYQPPDKRREWYEKAESQLAITPKASSKSRQGK